tara:strand:+ start:243 stop:476 length:234 start_codon:yes stop_codon:yes gene_type:complete
MVEDDCRPPRNLLGRAGETKEDLEKNMTLFTVTIIGIDGEVEDLVPTTSFAEANEIAAAATAEGLTAFITDEDKGAL